MMCMTNGVHMWLTYVGTMDINPGVTLVTCQSRPMVPLITPFAELLAFSSRDLGPKRRPLANWCTSEYTVV